MLTTPVYSPYNPPDLELSEDMLEVESRNKKYLNAMCYVLKHDPFVNLSFLNGTYIEFSTDNTLPSIEHSVLPAHYSKNFQVLKSLFDKEYQKGKALQDASVIKTKFYETASFLSELPFERAAVEIPGSSSIRFTLKFNDDKLLLISKALESVEDLQEDEIIFSFFINRELIISNAASISTFVEGFKELLDM